MPCYPRAISVQACCVESKIVDRIVYEATRKILRWTGFTILVQQPVKSLALYCSMF